MAEKTYIVNQESPESITGFENFNSQDVSLINSFEVNTLFNPDKNFMELHVISLIDELLESDYNYVSYKQLGNAQSAGKSGASILTLDPISDVKRYGYENGSVKLLYHFLNDLFSETKTPVEFFIESISEDRTELRLQTLQLSAEKITERVNEVKTKLQDQSYFSEFRLDFKNNDLFIGLNIDTFDLGFDKAVVVKLYEPLPVEYVEKSKLTIVEVIADSVAYEVDYEVTEEEPVNFSLKPANFNLEVADDHVVPTGYFNYEELFSYPVNNSNSQIYSMISQKGIELSIDHTNYSNFIHFSSAQERLLNFKYKLDLISSSYANINVLNSATTGISGVSGSQQYYNGVIEGIVNNFDHYERFLYYESGSSSWPKSNTTKPYINKPSTALESTTWFTNQVTTAITYDLTNYNSVLSSIPSYIKDDTNNEAYLTFVYMLGQHFDLLWIYAKAVSDKYNADNRLEYGISKDLIAEALKNFGVKLYTSNKSIADLFTTITGQSYQSGSEVINSYVTGSLTGSNTPVQPVSYDGYTKEVQKRIYHNLPFLLKSKGTERGIRALINCFGIPSDTLQVKLYGGRNTNERPFFGDYEYYTSSLDKVRLDNTGSLVSGSTLSNYVSIVKRDDKYTDDLHTIEVGFSLTDNIDNYIVSRSSATFNIDNYLGDPGNLFSGSYSGLEAVASVVLSGSLGTYSHYNLQDYVRLIKFFDNTVFKMVKDFIPARVVADTGVIIKPHLLNRSKAKSVKATVDTIADSSINNAFNYTSSINTAFISSSDSGWISSKLVTSYVEIPVTPTGTPTETTSHRHEEPRYNGELKNSGVVISDGELNRNNTYKSIKLPQTTYGINFYKEPPSNVCVLPNTVLNPLANYIVSSLNSTVNLQTVFSPYATATTVYTQSINPVVGTTFTFAGSQYSTFPVTASTALANCSSSLLVELVKCDLTLTSAAPSVVTSDVYDLGTWFTGQTTNTQNRVVLTYGVQFLNTIVLTAAQTGSFNFSTTIPDISNGDFVTVTMQDTHDTVGCAPTITVQYKACTLNRSNRVLSIDQMKNISYYFTGTTSTTEYYFKPYTYGKDTWLTWKLNTRARGITSTAEELGELYPITASSNLPLSPPGNNWPEDPGNTYWIKIPNGTGEGYSENFGFTYKAYDYATYPTLEDSTYIEVGDPIPDTDLRPNILTFQPPSIASTLWYRNVISKAIGKPTLDLQGSTGGSRGPYYKYLAAFQFRAVNSAGCIVDTEVISADVTDLPQPPAKPVTLRYKDSGDWFYGYSNRANATICSYYSISNNTSDDLSGNYKTVYINNGQWESLVTNPNQLSPIDFILQNELEIFEDSSMTTYAPTGQYGFGVPNTTTTINNGQRPFGYWDSSEGTWHTGTCGY